MGAEGAWSNQLVDLIILSAAASGFSGFFAYSPAPGAGNLIASIAAAGGTDPYGNHYQPGFVTYSGPNFWDQLLAGQLNFHVTAGQPTPASVASNVAGAIAITSGSAGIGDNQGEVLIESAQANDGTNRLIELLADQLLMPVLVLAVAGGIITINNSLVISSNLTVNGTTITGSSVTSVSVPGATIDVHNGNVNLNMARPPNYAAVVAGTATAAQVEACLGGLLTSLTNRQLMA